VPTSISSPTVVLAAATDVSLSDLVQALNTALPPMVLRTLSQVLRLAHQLHSLEAAQIRKLPTSDSVSIISVLGG
jgi:hypothetical protein